jgi:predicted ArsR family transcriptional regulator
MLHPCYGRSPRASTVSRPGSPLEIHKALADDTRFRLYRHLGLSGRPVSIRELSTRLSLHPNTLRPHLRRLEEVGLVQREVRHASSVGRPQTLYTVVEGDHEGRRDYRLLAEILASVATGGRSRERAGALASEWGRYLVGRGEPRPGTRRAGGRNLAVLQAAMAAAGFDPRFRREPAGEVQVSMRDCPFRDLLEDHRELVCGVHRGLLEGMLGALDPPHRLASYSPLVERTICRIVARPARG